MTSTGPGSRPSPRGRRAGREPGTGRRGARGALLGLGAGALLLGAGAWTWAAPSQGPVADAGRVPTAPATTASAATAAPTAAAQVGPSIGPSGASVAPPPAALPTLTAAATSFVPTRLQIPAIDVDSRVTPVSVTDGEQGGELGVPDDPAVLGWWRGGARPGSGLGTVVVDGHVDSKRYGTGPLYRATRLTIGDTATLSGADGQRRTYRVVALRTYLKATLPAQQIFTQSGPERLVVVTCGGEYHRGRGGWDSNVVVFLEPTR